MKSFALATVIGATNALQTSELNYMNYMATFNKQHDDVESFNFSHANFQFVDAFIKEHNATNATFTVGHNKFSDMSAVEKKMMNGYVSGENNLKSYTVLDTTMNANEVNWVLAGAVTPVKDQGQCGSCWAFSSTGSLEGAHFVATGELLSFSEQQLVDCAYIRYGNYGCNGGLQTNAYRYYEAGNFAELDSVYPYTSGKGVRGTCTYDASSTTAVGVTTYKDVTPNNVAQMKSALNQQPLAVAIQADQMVFQ